MPAVFFQMSNQQNSTLKTLMEHEGYKSKAEFFRFLMKFFEYYKAALERDSKNDLEIQAKKLQDLLISLDKQGKLGKLKRPLREQLDEDELIESHGRSDLYEPFSKAVKKTRQKKS